MTPFETAFQFFKQKFDLLLVAGLFTFVFCIYVWDANPDPARADKLYNLWNGLLYAFLALLGVRGATAAANNIRADNVSADTIQTASTQSGDIVSPKKTTPADPAKDEKENEIPTD